MSTLTLHGYWRSTASYRVRIAFNLKGIGFRQVTHDLRKGEQSAPDYVALSPQGLVPALDTGDDVLPQSGAIMEWLEEKYPTPPLLPKEHQARAIVRAMAATVGCDIHPLNNLRVLNFLRADFNATQSQIDRWISHWITEGFSALEIMIERHGGVFAFGNAPGLADCYLVPQLYAAERFKVDVQGFPKLRAVAEYARGLEAFAIAHPDRQPDADH